MTHAPAPARRARRRSSWRVEQLPAPFGDDLDAAAGHLDGGLIVDGVRRALYPGGPPFSLGHGSVRAVRAVEVREDGEIDNSQHAVATGGRLPADELLTDAGGQHHAPGTEPDVDRVAQRREEVG